MYLLVVLEFGFRFAVDPSRKQAYQSAYPRTSGLTGERSNGPTMSADGVTFGQAISKARKALGLSQKELAARVLKEEGGGSISPQYLNDIEHDRRSPTSDHLIRQFATVLEVDEGYLFVLAGKIPDELRRAANDQDKIVAAFTNFRKTLKD